MSSTREVFESFNRPFMAAFRATPCTTLKRVTFEIYWLSARALNAMNCFSLHTSSTRARYADVVLCVRRDGASKRCLFASQAIREEVFDRRILNHPHLFDGESEKE
jgi:hypothetical protein